MNEMKKRTREETLLVHKLYHTILAEDDIHNPQIVALSSAL